MTPLHILTYIILLIFAAAVMARIVRIARLPVHLRWELYPVPHERGRARYGGSILEEVDWWTKPRHPDHLGELRVMIPEILFLRGVWEHNRALWWGSFPLHFGLYLLIAALGCFGINAAWSVFGRAEIHGSVLIYLGQIIAWVGYTLGVIGALVMLWMRLASAKLRPYTNASHFFNLLLLGTMSLTGLVWMILDRSYAANLTNFLGGLLAPTTKAAISPIGYSHIGLSLFFFLYFPFTHMTHAFVKYFTYHDVRWEDTPNLPGGKLQSKIEKLEHQPVTWAAAHIGADGRKNWGDLAAESGEVKKS